MSESNAEWSLSALASAFSMDRRDVAEVLKAGGVQPRVQGKAHFFDIAKAIPLLIEKKLDIKDSQAPKDRRDNAIAEKNEIETLILRGKFVPIEEVTEPLRYFFTAFDKLLQESDLENAKKEIIVNRLHSIGAEIDTGGLEL